MIGQVRLHVVGLQFEEGNSSQAVSFKGMGREGDGEEVGLR